MDYTSSGAPAGASRGGSERLPMPTTPLVGRVRERAMLRALLRSPDTRLVTLTGAGGTGKSRLALAVAQDVVSSYPDGVWSVPLAALADVDLVPIAIAQALGLTLTPAPPPLERLTAFMRDKCLLLVLDNFEHLLAAAPVLSTLLKQAPLLQILVTSRVVLQLTGEHELRVPPLALPDPHAGLDAVLASDAVALFTQRAQAADPAFEVTPANAVTVAAICARVEGLPLGIELVAPRLRGLGLDELLARMRSNPASMVAHEHPHRQRTLAAMVEWSYRLLQPAEQRLFAQLAVFIGGWTLEAAAAVVEQHDTADGGVLGGLSALIMSSLVEQSGAAGEERRFRLLEPVREFAWGKLIASSEYQATRERHLRYFLNLAVRAERAAYSMQAGEWMRRLDTEYGNLRAALSWAIEARQLDAAPAMVIVLRPYWRYRGLLGEARAFMQAALALTEGGDPYLRTRIINETGWVLYLMGEYAQARERANEAQRRAKAMHDRANMASALHHLGLITAFAEGDDAGIATIKQAQALYRDLGDMNRLAGSAYMLGEWKALSGEPREALAWYRESERLATAGGNVFRQAAARWSIANLSKRAGDTATARQLLDGVLAVFRQLGDFYSEARALIDLAAVDLADDDPATAQTRARGVLPSVLSHGMPAITAWCHRMLGMACFAVREYGEARLEFTTGVALANDHDIGIERGYGLLYLAKLELELDNVRAAAAALHEYATGCKGVAGRQREDVAAFPEAVSWLVIRTAPDGVETQALRDAALLLGSAEAIRIERQDLAYPFMRRLNDTAIDACRRQFGNDAFEAAWTEGRRLAVDDALALAVRRLEQTDLQS